jgi:hypothetical protein
MRTRLLHPVSPLRMVLDPTLTTLVTLMTEEKLIDKFNPSDKPRVKNAINNAISWLSALQEAAESEYYS